MSVFVFAGAAQLAMVPLISAGASVAVIVLTVLVINLPGSPRTANSFAG
jgi:predicted branched-subunit amino acid permease